VDLWVTEGIISRDQAASICEFERRVAPSRVHGAEALAYAGSAIAAGLAVSLVASVWLQLSHTERTAAAGLVAVSLMLVGTFADANASPAMRRLSNTTFFLSVPAIGITVGLWASTIAGPETSTLLASTAASTVALPLYAWRRSSPQQVAVFLATLSFIVSVVMRFFESVPAAIPGVLVFVVGAGWVVATSVGWITPRLTGEIVGAAASLIGSMLLFMGLDSGGTVALAVAVAVSAGTVAIGVIRSRIVLTIVGVAALASYVPWLASVVLGPSTGAPFILAAAAMSLALWATRKKA
jgi:hypothetical protein